jgi:hypothetical protein
VDDRSEVGQAVAPGSSRTDYEVIKPITATWSREGTEMNAYFTQELTRQHQADLLREAHQGRLAKIAREGGEVAFGGPIQNGRGRLILALGGAAAAILATATAVIAGH